MRHPLFVGLAAGTTLVGLVAVGSCAKKTTTPPATKPPIASTRCDIDLSSFTSAPGAGVVARVIADPSDLIGGEAASGRLGDYLLANDKIRLIVQQPSRFVGPNPYGGALIDADFVHGGAGNDKFGKLAPFFNFGRTVNANNLEIINSGAQGGPAIIAATGRDEVNDYLNIKSVLASYLGTVSLVIDPDVRANLTVTTYYILAPEQTHATIITAFCNSSGTDALMTAGDLIDSGGDVAVFVPQSQTGGFGYATTPDPMRWLGWMASDNSVAYGVAPYKLNDLKTPETHSNSLTTAGVTGYVIGNNYGIDGLLEWTETNQRNRSGSLVVPANGSAVIGREFAVGHDLGEVATTLETIRASLTDTSMGPIGGLVSDGTGVVAGARVVVERVDPDGIAPTRADTFCGSAGSCSIERMGVFVTAGDGTFSGQLPAGHYLVTAWKEGRTASPSKAVDVGPNDSGQVSLTTSPTANITVNVQDASGNPLPAKVTILCQSGICTNPPTTLNRFDDHVLDPRPDNVQFIGFVTPSGTESFPVPPGRYSVIVSHGPEYSLYPLTAPNQDAVVDLTSTNSATINAKLAKVVDTKGWMSADFHIHTVNSPDSWVPVVDRVKTFLAEGVNVALSTDHDYITDFAPVNQQLGGTSQMATMIGIEVTTFDYGHYNPWPVHPDDSDTVTHGAIDWACGDVAHGDCPSLSIDEIFAHARTDLQATTIQINHPDSSTSTFGGLGLDAATLVTHVPASQVRQATSPRATATDTGLFPTSKWDSMEIMNGFSQDGFNATLNNWMTFVANGLVVTGTAVSDTHKRWSVAAGYPRSYVRMSNTAIGSFDPAAMSQAVNAHQVQGSLGLFVNAYAFPPGTGPTLTAGNAPVDLDAACTGVSHCTRIGDTLSTSTGFDLYVDVQAPDWISFDSIEVLNHATAHPMVDGVPNSNFGPASGANGNGYYKQSVTLDANGPEHEVVLAGDSSLGCGQATCNASRWHVQQVFHLTGADAPTADDFYFVVVRGSQSLMPLVYDGTQTSNGSVTAVAAKPFNFTNPIFIDADGSGAYDHFPHVTGSQPSPSPAPSRPHPSPGSGPKSRPERVRDVERMLKTLEAEP
jgi:hypothetical protein